MITIYGASDDLVEVEGCKGADEFSPRDVYWQGDLIALDGAQMRVHVYYDGCWQAGVGMVDESVPLPLWPLTFSQGDGDRYPAYSTVLSIDAPEGTRLTNVGGAR